MGVLAARPYITRKGEKEGEEIKNKKKKHTHRLSCSKSQLLKRYRSTPKKLLKEDSGQPKL